MPDASSFAVQRSSIKRGLSLAYVREGIGGYPLVLLHGYPETKRIWWRNIQPLAEAGFEVIVPDLRGYGDSDLAPEGIYDIVAYSLDVYSLVHDVLGHQRCAMAAGDIGGVVMLDLSLRFPGFVERQCFFNSVAPMLGELYSAHGLSPDALSNEDPTGDYRVRQGGDPDQLMAELDTPQRRRSWVAAMYGHRLWGARGSFSPSDVDFMTEPFADPDRLRASWGPYGLAYGRGAGPDIPRLFEVHPVPTLVMYGMEDQVVGADFVRRCELAFSECIGPFLIPRAGHFLQWERSELFNRSLAWFLRDLTTQLRP
jgi:pimeloyl-ACP methyl ester carboxylesterase